MRRKTITKTEMIADLMTEGLSEEEAVEAVSQFAKELAGKESYLDLDINHDCAGLLLEAFKAAIDKVEEMGNPVGDNELIEAAANILAYPVWFGKTPDERVKMVETIKTVVGTVLAETMIVAAREKEAKIIPFPGSYASV